MNNFVLIFLCLGLGYLFRGIEKFPKTTAKSLNSFVIFISFPAVILTQVPTLLNNLDFNFSIVLGVLVFWLLYLFSAIFFFVVGKKLNWSPKTIGALTLTAGLSNTSFVGFPLLEALLGSGSIQSAILLDQLGTFLICSILGVLTASIYARSKHSATIDYKKIIFNILKFPPFIALTLTSLITFMGLDVPSYLHEPALKLAQTLIPLALFAVGFQLNIKADILKYRILELSLGLFFKLILSPLIVIFIYFLMNNPASEFERIVILESAMAPMITAAVIVSEFDLDSDIANLMVGLGIPISLLTVSLIHFFIL